MNNIRRFRTNQLAASSPAAGVVYLKQSREVAKPRWLKEAPLTPGLTDLCAHLINPPHLATNTANNPYLVIGSFPLLQLDSSSFCRTAPLVFGLGEETLNIRDKTPWQSDKPSISAKWKLIIAKSRGWHKRPTSKVEERNGKLGVGSKSFCGSKRWATRSSEASKVKIKPRRNELMSFLHEQHPNKRV